MTEADIVRIEAELKLRLPLGYREYLAQEDMDVEEHGPIDDTAVMRDADAIIEATRDYQAGFEGLPPWPANLLYLGDEADACPYVLDCDSGGLKRLDKGNLNREPLAQWPSFDVFLQQAEDEAKQRFGLDADVEGKGWKSCLPGIVGFGLVFVVIPVTAFIMKVCYRWLVYGEKFKWEGGW